MGHLSVPNSLSVCVPPSRRSPFLKACARWSVESHPLEKECIYLVVSPDEPEHLVEEQGSFHSMC